MCAGRGGHCTPGERGPRGWRPCWASLLSVSRGALPDGFREPSEHQHLRQPVPPFHRCSRPIDEDSALLLEAIQESIGRLILPRREGVLEAGPPRLSGAASARSGRSPSSAACPCGLACSRCHGPCPSPGLCLGRADSAWGLPRGPPSRREAESWRRAGINEGRVPGSPASV